MKKEQKKRIWGTSLIILAALQILHFARWNPKYFPKLNLNFKKIGIHGITFSLISWPFKLINHIVYFFFGWAGLFTPLFLIALGYTFFYPRETKKVKRKRLIIIWGVLELVFFVYYINTLSVIITPRSMTAGLIPKLFATYLMKIGGFSFLTLFFL